ncbi:MAG: penicillin-binding protein 2 [Bacteroidetes bacterium]|nr:penicillin-binding protein 2 [Bacteroidota bacterium]
MSFNTFGTQVRRRIIFFILISFIGSVVISLFQMQILENQSFEKKSNENSVKKEIIDAPRGIFYDRYFKVAISNKPTFTFRITPATYNKSRTSMIESVINSGSGFVDQVLKENKHQSIYSPLRVKKDVDFNFVSWYEENSENLPGVSYAVELQRDYSFGINASHMLGYVKEISMEQLDRNREKYSQGDFVGYTGLEKQYENYLCGEKGYRLYLIDSKQKPIGRYNEGKDDKIPQKGNDIVLTIDKQIQKIAEDAFMGKRGALVAIEPSTGEILAFVSSPSFNLADFDAVTSSKVLQEYIEDESKPLYNRATMSINSPGSTFKVMNLIAALETGIVTPETTIRCTGGIQYGDRFFGCMHTHGTISAVEAIEKSCNSYFYNIILKMDLDTWADYARQFGFGSKPGIDIPEQASGLVPDSDYYNRVVGKGKWAKGWTISLGIGQGELGVSVAQLAKYAALVANNGKTKVPHLVKGYIRSEDREFSAFDFDDVKVNVSEKTFDIVKLGMYKVVNGNGSATNIRNAKIAIAGKTGTSQNPHGDNHAVFVGFAPFEKPEIAIAVLVENVGFGSTHAAPIARDVIVAYLNNKRVNAEKQFIANAGKGN